MSTHRVQASQLGAVFRTQATRLPKIASLGLRVGVEKGRGKVRQRTPVGLPPGAMRLAWKIFPWGKLGWKLDNSAPHAGIVEAGARPHAVSREGVAAIREWVARVLPLISIRRGPGAGKSGPAQLTRRKATLRERSEDFDVMTEIDAITWAIVNKIKTSGQAPHWVVKGCLPQLEDFARYEVQAAITAYLERPPETA